MGMPVRRITFTRKLETSIEHDGGVYLAEVTLECYPGSPGKMFGPPEDCYPPELDNTEVTDIRILAVEEDGREEFVGEHVHWDINIDDLICEAFGEQNDEDSAAWEEHWEHKLDALREGD